MYASGTATTFDAISHAAPPGATTQRLFVIRTGARAMVKRTVSRAASTLSGQRLTHTTVGTLCKLLNGGLEDGFTNHVRVCVHIERVRRALADTAT